MRQQEETIFKKRIGCLSPQLRFSRSDGHPPLRSTAILRRGGQAMTEFVVMLPVFVILGAGVIFFSYIFWQGIKVQQAATLASRILSQERVAGGPSSRIIDDVNGKKDGGHYDRADREDPPPGSVFATYDRAVSDLFGIHDPSRLRTLPPNIQLTTDMVIIKRIITLPDFLTKLVPSMPKQIVLTANGYGGEDTFMFGLPRWAVSSGTQKYWQHLVQQVNSLPNARNATSYD